MDNICPECQQVFCIDHIFGTKCKSVATVDTYEKMSVEDKFFLSDSCGMLEEDIATFSSIKSINYNSLIKLGEPSNKLNTSKIVAIIKIIKERHYPPCAKGTKVAA